jgi:uncharacterized protein YkwD
MKVIQMIAILVFASVGATMGQDVCTKQTGESMKIHVRNGSDKAITVNYVDENCKESKSDERIEPGRAFSGDVTSGDAFRVREADSNNLIQTVVANPSKTSTSIGIVKNSDPRQSFIQTLNQIRRGRGLPSIELDESLNKSCQWFADLMAKHDKGGHDAVEIGGSSFTDMQHPWLRSTKMGYAGDGGTEATSNGGWADISTLGAERMLGWSSSDTHFRPFLGLEGQMFKHVGFGYAKSGKKPNEYYTCAVFGNPPENAGGGNSGGGNNNSQGNNDAGNKEPVKTDVPDGLKFNESKFFVMANGAEKYGTSFAKSSFDELNAEFSFENPSSQAFAVQVKSYLNDKLISSDPMTDLKGTGAMSVRVAGEAGQMGKVAPGKYRFEVLLNGEVVASAEAVVR